MQLGFPDASVTRKHSVMALPPDFVFSQLRRAQNFKVNGIIEIVAVISDLIREIRDLRLQRGAIILCVVRRGQLIEGLVLPQTFAHFERQVKTREIWIWSFEQLDYAHALAVVIEPAVFTHTFGQHLLARVPKRRMPQIVRQRDRFREILVQS